MTTTPLDLDSAWTSWLQDAFSRILKDPQAAQNLLAAPEADIFEAGFDSLRTFTLSDELFAAGVDVDFAQIVEQPTTAFLAQCIRDSGASAPA
ncbi:phosphopantetheine-binding protein [Brevibacterium sp. 50QC2O2]|uniref:phosphopantetheine-binding protein n=1 Tax=Brevibacterium TaxID=1696 RepID=UPI00211B7E1B|nr:MULTISPECIES: phosphopantetheine-binding protein [unclassified Brevibacterium]MCQ9369264.1 phosphopantetheine-binding protein [Brevibacterium sp. 91QC2O2]MCQ9386711.1 phosphopantetheine-binding protein [Brevibacterium sp. 68QC2CO]MCQ9389335.1 phosphopantetheine-binding protein [Brevibacterium sp. 50QC2O2]